jgi:MFS family permease
MIPVVARDVLRVSPGLMGLITSAHGLGAFAGSLVVASSPGIRYHGRVYLAGSVLTLAAVLGFSLSRSYALSAAIVLLAGFGNAGFNTMQMSLAMLLPKDGMRGIALGAVSLGVGGGPVGMLITGGVATAIGTTGALGINGGYGLLAILLVASLAPSLRRESVPDATPSTRS